MNSTHAPAFLKRRKFLMVLPLLVLPFMTMAFWSLGGGKGKEQQTVAVSKGLNMALPDADFKNEKPVDKMGLFDQAQRDSAKLMGRSYLNEGNSPLSGDGAFAKADASEIAIQAKLAQIDKEVSSKPSTNLYNPQPSVGKPDPVMSADVAKLEALMKNMQSSGNGDDPEIRQLNSMMDKILAIQNPEAARKIVPQTSVVADSLFKAVPAELVSTAKVTQGSVIEVRLLDTLFIAGQMIPKGHSVFGLAVFSNQRISLDIKNIRLGTSIIPVNLSVYDKRDGMPGINAPEALLSEAVGNGSIDAMGSVGLMGFDQNLGTQIAGAGLNAAKGLFSKKIKRVKQKLTAGYPLLLRDNNRKSNR